MNAQQTIMNGRTQPRGGPLLGFGTVFHKEVQEWFRGRRGLVVGLSALGIALFTVLIPFVVKATDAMGTAPDFSMDPTDNVLLGWATGTVTFQAFLVVLATLGLMTVERDRGTLAWSLTNPVSRTALLLAKWAATVVVLGLISILLPLGFQVAVAYVAYGGLADIPVVLTFAALYLAVPAFYVAVTLAAGTFITSTAGVAGIGFVVMFLPSLIGPLVPGLADISPTSVHSWAFAVVTGAPVNWALPIATAIVVGAIGVSAKLAFDRQDF